MNKKTLCAIFILLILLITTVSALHLMGRTRIPSGGEVRTVNLTAWQDIECTIPLTYIDWETMYPNDTKTFKFYLRSIGNTPVILRLATMEWNPIEIEEYITVTWDNENTTLNLDETLEITIQILISPDWSYLFKDFNFIIEISGWS